MFEQVAKIEARYEEIAHKLCDSDTLADAAQYTALMKEYRSLEPLVNAYKTYCEAQKMLEEAKNLLAETDDAELKELAEEERKTATEQIARTEEELKILLLPHDPNDSRNVILEIRGGVGGEEAALFAAVLYRMYGMYAESKGWQMELLNVNETELGGFKEISVSINGAGAYSRLKYESGVHRVQRVPETETQGRIHTSAVTVAVLPEVDEVEIDINPNDLQIDTFRSSGAGGQHINKTSSAIRITHLPTGMVVECQDERSQYKNKDKAMKVLRSRLFEQEQRKQDESVASERRTQVGSGDRSERIRTYNYPQSRITDHRIGLTLYQLEDFVNGGLDPVIDALITAERTKLLAGRENEND